MNTERTVRIGYRPTYRLADLPEVDIPPEVAKQLAERINAKLDAQITALLRYSVKPNPPSCVIGLRFDA